MKDFLSDILFLVACGSIAPLAAGCALILGRCAYRCISSAALWRQDRATIAVLLSMMMAATIVAQKDRTGGAGTGNPPAAVQQPGEVGAPPDANAMTNTLHFADIAVHMNGTAMLSIVWPLDLIPTNTTIDLFAATSLVDSVWVWWQSHEVGEGETNWTATVALPEVTPGTNAPVAFFRASHRETCAATMADSDLDGFPDVYELANGTNPYVPDYESAPKLTVGPNGDYPTMDVAIAASAPYSIIELDPAVRHEVTDYFGVDIPQHPIMVTAPSPYAVVHATGVSAFMLATNTTSHTMFRNLYVLLARANGFQVGFWCGGSVPDLGVPASATFDNIYIRMPNPGVQYRGWIFYRNCADRALLRGCTLNASGATWVTGIDAFGAPPLAIDRCSFVNFPADSLAGNSCGVLLRTTNASDGGAEVTISRTLFDESFADAYPVGRFDSIDPYFATMSDSLVPCPLPSDYLPDVVTNLVVTNASLTWLGIPWPSSPSVALGIGSFSPVAYDPTVDTDNDTLYDYHEVYDLGTDPFLSDTDNDGVDDDIELNVDGTDPADPHSFKQRLTVTMTNTASMAHAVYTAWGYSATGWETNGQETFMQGFGSTNYVDVILQGATYAKAFCDLNDNGVFDAACDILLVRQIPYGSAPRIKFTFGDVDGDGISDEQERTDGTSPYDGGNYCYGMSVDVAGIFHTTNQLSLTATFGTNTMLGPLAMVTNRWSMDLGMLTATNGERVTLTFWDDANSNGVCEVEETSYSHTLPVTNRFNCISFRLPYGTFDADGNGLLDWWEIQTGLAASNEPHGQYDDTDSDGLINLHEYWAGCDPLVPDGSNTVLSIMARNVDDYIEGRDPEMCLARFLNYAANGTNFVVNPNFWASHVDLSCASPWNSIWPYTFHAGTAISPRHIILATHFETPTNSIYYFRDSSGVVYARMLVAKHRIQMTDITIGLLDSELPVSIHPAKMLPYDYANWIGDGCGLPALTLNRHEEALVMELNAMPKKQIAIIGCHVASTERRRAFFKSIETGDSSNPRFLIFDGEPVLLHTIWHGGYGDGVLTSHLLMEIQTAMDTLLSGYELQTIDLSFCPRLLERSCE